MDLFELIDTERYPLHDPDGAAYADLVDRAAAQLSGTGASELAGFLNAEGLAVALADALGARAPRLPQRGAGHGVPGPPRRDAARGPSPPLLG